MIQRLRVTIRDNPLNLLLRLSLVVIGTDNLETSPLTTLVVSAVAMIPVAGLIGEATESIAANVGSRLSGLLNATFGIAAELTITIVAIREGLLELVKSVDHRIHTWKSVPCPRLEHAGGRSKKWRSTL
jgi:Ca2+:H+ antiporter